MTTAPPPPEQPQHVPPPVVPPPPPSAPPPVGLATSVELRISKRLLWIGTAAYPLHNIARVYTFTLHPRRKEAVMRFLRRSGLVLGVAMLVTLPAMLPAAFGDSTLLALIWFVAFGLWIFCLVDMITVLSATSHYVLAVETNGASTGVVTSRQPHYLNQLVGQISYAIDHPDTELQVTVESISISPSHYYFGDNVNMYGGSGNVGMAA
ncbi:hypothetical protein G3I32_12215 [Streptomyces coelicoflavus]|uniref:Uncharacterized protein n=1 Tax=Streptomyces coelicoflavus TaxID=285562 RepID=A0A7K3PJS3_9ACTN|nr:DUF6232 family protein [Streptomyces coelicoflavus]NEB09621.1 hypothetical protein [Streptomyces coelicoflavus]